MKSFKLLLIGFLLMASTNILAFDVGDKVCINEKFGPIAANFIAQLGPEGMEQLRIIDKHPPRPLWRVISPFGPFIADKKTIRAPINGSCK